ncbi:hypothetical protein OK016_28610 [Vibrio chagasii]|nr:hypothetical protein [Vibrio chagasii]
METTSGYNQMVKYHASAKVDVKFNQWSGTSGNTYNIYFDGVKVANWPNHFSSQTTASFEYGQGGLLIWKSKHVTKRVVVKAHPLKSRLPIRDGAHLAPLAMNIDPNNKSYNTDPNTVVGTYFC